MILNRAIASSVRLACGLQARWTAPPITDKAVIYFANHSSNLDAAAIWAALPTRFRDSTRPVAAQDYWDAGPVRRFLANRVFKAILIERKNVTASRNPLTPMLAALDQGSSLIIFPEGGRHPGPTPGEFKSGIYHLARQRPGHPLVPVYLQNLNRVLPKGEFLPVPLLGNVTIGPPLFLMQGESKTDFLQRARQAVWDLHLP
jgi:1-acyl-sn-glycerol-3-phosphate acyltransferase